MFSGISDFFNTLKCSRALEVQKSSCLSQVSCGHFCFLDPLVDYLINLVEAAAQFGVIQNLDGNDLREARPQDSVIGAGKEKRGTPALSGYLITVSSRYP